MSEPYFDKLNEKTRRQKRRNKKLKLSKDRYRKRKEGDYGPQASVPQVYLEDSTDTRLPTDNDQQQDQEHSREVVKG